MGRIMLRGKGKKKADNEPAAESKEPNLDHEEKGQNSAGTVEAAVPAAETAVQEPSPEDKLAEVQDKYLRAVAELDNFKKRAEREKNELSSYIKVSLFRDLLPVLDDFGRFFEHVENGEAVLDQGFVQGIELIHKSLLKLFEKHGVEAIEKAGVPVDYNIHEAVLTQPVENKDQDHTVVQILEVGYRIGDKLIRPAKGKVGLFNQ
ncbi:MAG: nucleotide exchange factor GrpE [Candidatus Glassbacteria bacterium GWA2_58_10]|uniref:Protein GrpE n=1 Tax=Candidatus Glassbacteria bacterium GWA2_58_10 TaxID=1817865 RepID=A0A1F5YDB7_9BACT|nr:MAG: nucleotide exchange factor GrpE [Candidatus Glassbacteria bacterium GWA2_58_10]